MYDKVYRPLYTDSDGHEMVCWVMPGVPLTIFSNHFSADTFDYLDWHWHEEVQFCLALKGNICIEVDTNIYLLVTGIRFAEIQGRLSMSVSTLPAAFPVKTVITACIASTRNLL